MSEIKIERKPGEERLKSMGIFDWPIWTKEESEFPWSYDEPEVVTPEGGEPVEVGQGDLVTFPKGMSCTWKVRKDVKKHYKFG
jgi:uncharacterized cupin superfamily protein